jgi:arginyl-tRNA synthetase
MNIYTEIKNAVLKVLGLSDVDFAVETPKFEGQGDVSLNVAMVLSKKYGKNPVAIAEDFLPQLQTLPFIEKVEIAGAGFLNITLKHDFILSMFARSIIKNYGFSDIGKGEKVNVEYCSANPTGPIHIGHARGTVYGDVICELMAKNGFNVTREYYINDAGGQVETLLKSVFIRVRQIKGENIEIPDGCYPGEYLIPIAKKVITEFGESYTENRKKAKEFIVNELMKEITNDLKKLNVIHDVFTSESKIIEDKNVEKAIEILNQKGLLYKGVLPKPKGRDDNEWEEREQTLFKSTNFGDSEDRAVQKSDGTYTYFTSDIGYEKNKLDRGFTRIILCLGADHAGYTSRIISATRAVAQNPDLIKVEVKACQIVKFVEGGAQVKMSKRKGTFTTLNDVLEVIDKDILRFILLTKKNDSQMDFDLTKAKEHTKENPIFYIQYANSRASSVLRNYNEEVETANLTLLNSKEEREIIKKILEYPKVIEIATNKLEPHLIANFIFELASLFHSFWNLGNENPKMRFISENQDLTKARIFLIRAILNIINSSLSVFKITPMEKM